MPKLFTVNQDIEQVRAAYAETEATVKADAIDLDMIPARPWGIELGDKFLRVCSLEEDGSFGEVVFYMNYDDQSGAHQPIEMARAKFIVAAVNSYSGKATR